MSRTSIDSQSALRIRIPATTANLGAAFDAVGLALQLYLRLEVRRLAGGDSRIEFSGKDAALVPTGAGNLIWRVMADTAGRKGESLPPFALTVRNEIPITKGLGSSATACLAGAAAADFLCRLELSQDELLGIASAWEGHPDNVAPSLLGGLVSSVSGEKILCSRAAFPESWTVVAVTPDFELETRKARAALPPQVPHADAVFNVQRAAFLVSQILQGRREGLREAMRDRLHQPYRSPLLPGLEEVLAMEDSEGLLGVALSGAGPTVIAFADARAAEIGERIRAAFARRNLASEVRLLKADSRGMIREEAVP
jgi:homoserine kinase